MRLPRQLIIGGNVWRVRYVRDLPEGWVGHCDCDGETLEIAAGLPPRMRLLTLIHEALHAIEDEYELAIPHDLIKQLEEPLARLIVENFAAKPRRPG